MCRYHVPLTSSSAALGKTGSTERTGWVSGDHETRVTNCDDALGSIGNPQSPVH